MGSGAHLRVWLGSPHPSGLWLGPSPLCRGECCWPPEPSLTPSWSEGLLPATWHFPSWVAIASVFSTSYSPPYL